MSGSQVILLLAALVSAVSIATAQSCPSNKRTVVVTGTGSVGVPTTIAVVRLGVQAEAATAVAAQSALSTAANKLISFLKTQPSVSKLQTTGINLNEQRNFNVSPPVTVGFQASNTVSFEVPVEATGAVLDGAVKNGASNIESVSFKATDQVVAGAREKAIKDAVANAKREADIAVKAAGRTLGLPLNIAIDNAASNSSPPSFGGGAQFSSKAAAPPVLPQEQQVTARVTVTYESL